MGDVMKDLADAFSGESQANRKYTIFASKAEQEGLPNIALLFKAAAEAEAVHAQAHLRVIGGVKSTKENLEAAIRGEAHEFKEMYPSFIKDAEEEGNKSALISFKNANAVEEIHHNLYKEALEAVEKGQDLPKRDIYVCQICGNTVYGEPPERCPICNAPRKRFKKIE
jgi:rubrerythrin